MNSHIPFDANNDWTLDPYHCNQSNDPLVDKVIGNAYAVVRAVYCNLGNLKLLYDFLNTYGMVLGVKSEAELKKLNKLAKYARIYGYASTGDRQVTDYLYVPDDTSGIRPDDPTATGSWIKVATSETGGGGEGGGQGAYIPYVYANGSALGGETSFKVPDGTIGVPFLIINGSVQYIGFGFTYSAATATVTLSSPLVQGDEVIALTTAVPANPDNPDVSNWVQVNWLYNNGAAVGGEQVITVPYTFKDVPAVYKNGLRLYKGLQSNSYTADPETHTVTMTEILAQGDRVIITLGGESETLMVTDRTVQEVARSNNVRDDDVVLSSTTNVVITNKKVIYDVVAQKSWRVPSLPPNAYIVKVEDGKLTYNPGGITVDLLEADQLEVVLDPILSRMAAEIGLPMTGTFEDGANITTSSQTVGYKAEGKLYRWAGNLPKQVPAGSTPLNSGGISDTAWVRTDQTTLRSQLASDTGSDLTAYKSKLNKAVKRAIASKFADEVSVKDFGAVGDGVTDDTAAIQAAIDSGTRASEQLPSASSTVHTLVFPEGKYAVSGLLVGRRCNLYFDGGSLQPLDPSATQPYLIKFAEGYNKVYGICIDMKYAINYDTAIWCRGRYMTFTDPEIWAFKCAWTFGDPAWKDNAANGSLGDSEIQIIGGWCNWGITHHRAYGINTIIQIIGHEAYSYKWSLPEGDPRKAAWEALPEITGYNCGALIYLTGSFTGNYSGQQPNFLSQMQITNDPAYKNSYGRYVLTGTHCETGNLFQTDSHGSNDVQDFSTQMLTATNCTGYVSGGRGGYFINGGDAGQGISINACSFYGVNIKDKAIYALNSKVHVSADSFPDLTSANVLEAMQVRYPIGYESYNPVRVGTSSQVLSNTLTAFKPTTMLTSDLDPAYAATFYNSTTGDFSIPQKMRNVEVDVVLSPASATATDNVDIALYVNGSQTQVLSTVGTKPHVTFRVRSLKQGDVVQVRVAHYQNRTLDGTASNSIGIYGAS